MLKRIYSKICKIPNKLRKIGIVNFKLVVKKPKNIPKFIIKLGGLIFNYYEPVLYVGGNEKFSQIQEAVNNSKDTPKYKVIIKVNPGVYSKVKVGGERNISIIGSDKHTCIIRDDYGIYANAPLEIEGDCLVKNLTIISTHNKNNADVDSLRAYAVHADWYGKGISEFNNCIFSSDQNAAFGCGLHQNQTVKLINCELYSHTPPESSMTKNGALFVHCALENDITEQHLIVENCKIESDISYALYINDCNKELGLENISTMDVTFINTKLYSKELGSENIVNKETPNNNCYSGQIKLTENSKGNNLKELNYYITQ